MTFYKMKDETIYETQPLKRSRQGENRFENMGIIILLLVAIIILMVLFMYSKGNPEVAIGLSEVLTMVLV